MAELATIARPYAEALFQAVRPVDAQAVQQQVSALAEVGGNAALRQFADDPKTSVDAVFALATTIVGEKTWLGDAARNLLRLVIENGRLEALPAIASQYQTLVNASSGVSDATIYSAFPIDDNALPNVVAALERRFSRKLNPTVQVDPQLIGGIRVVVGDEVLDTSVKARLAQMKAALTA
jgi:F-type H+-transporting ATPase subunit delta